MRDSMFPTCVKNYDEKELEEYNKFYKTNYEFFVCKECKSWFIFEKEKGYKTLCPICMK